MDEYEGHDQESTPEQIAQAIEQGWVDDPSHPKYKPASEFLAVGEKIAPVVAKHAKELENKLARAREEHKREIEELRADIFRQEKAGYDRAVKEIETKRQRAYEDEDVNELKRLEKEAAELEPPKQPEPKKEVNTEFLAWRRDNSWYMNQADPDDMAKTAYADAILDRVREEVIRVKGEYTTNTDIFKAVELKVKERFGGKKKPEHAVESGGSGNRGSKQSWGSLPKSVDKSIASKVADKHFGGDKEAYAKAWFAEFGEK